MVPRIGTEFAGYRIVALLGRGGMSVVYRAENPRLGMTVALKVLAPELADNESFRERFVSESRLITALNHPSIVTIYEAGEADGSLYIAMRYFATDLRRVLDDAGALSPERTLAVVGDVAGALDAAHGEGLVHRDVKPANILLDDVAGRAYLTDFGIAKLARAHSGPTSSGEFLGTIEYMAPEQIEERPVDGRADLYSLACVAFECLTGSPPFRRENDAAVLWAHMQEPPPDPSEQRPGLSPGFDEALTTGLAKAPDERFASCREFVAALDAGARGEPVVRRRAVVPKPSDRAEDLGRKPSRFSRRALALLAVLGTLVAGAAFAVVALGRDDPPPERVVTPTTTVPTTAEAPPDGLTAFDQELLRVIPVEFRGSCIHAEPIASGFDATLSCVPSEGVGPIRYSHARSGDLLREHLRGQVVEAGIPLSADDGLTALGSCPDSRPALQEWEMDGPAGHREVNSQRLVDGGVTRGELQRRVIGHVLCYSEEEQFQLQWSDRKAGVYVYAGGDPDSLVTWWRSSAGPIH